MLSGGSKLGQEGSQARKDWRLEEMEGQTVEQWWASAFEVSEEFFVGMS